MEQDEWAGMSNQRAAAAIKAGLFKEEIVPVEIKTKKGTMLFEVDENPKGDTTIESLLRLLPATVN